MINELELTLAQVQEACSIASALSSFAAASADDFAPIVELTAAFIFAAGAAKEFGLSHQGIHALLDMAYSQIKQAPTVEH